MGRVNRRSVDYVENKMVTDERKERRKEGRKELKKEGRKKGKKK